MIIQKLTLDELQQKICKNKKYRQLIEAFQTNKLYNIPLENYKEEILALHQVRQVRTLIKFCDDSSLNMVDGIIRSNMQDQGQRSRLAEIHLQCIRASSALSDAIKVFKDYALVRYDSYLSKIRTKGERSIFIDTCLADMQVYLSNCDLVINLTKIVIDDIDKAGWSIERTIKALSLTQVTERKV